MKKASWIILSVVGGLTLLGSLFSVGVAYASLVEDKIGPATLTELSAGSPDLATAVKARRATAGAYGAGFATLFLAITLGPYRRGDVWAWWALLAGMLVVSVLILLRVPFLGINLGAPRGGHWGGDSPFESRSAGSGRTQLGSRQGPIEKRLANPDA